jgi:hypothetical protein
MEYLYWVLLGMFLGTCIGIIAMGLLTGNKIAKLYEKRHRN